MTAFHILAAAVLLAAVPAPVGASPFGQPDRDYSAVGVIESGGQTVQQRIAYSRDRMRLDMPGGVGAIVRFDRQAVFMLMPGGQCMPMPRQQAAHMLTQMMDESRTRRTAVGRETIDGRPATRYTFETEMDGITNRGTTWITEEGLAVRTQGTTTMAGTAHAFTMTLKDVVFAPQDASLFEPPSGCPSPPGG